jgi:hypothetical protein
MSLAAILGISLLLPWLRAGLVPSVLNLAVGHSLQTQENQPASSSPQSSSTQPPTDQQKAPDQSAAPPPPTSVSPPCAEQPQPGSTTKPDCPPAKSAGAKTKKHHRTPKAIAPARTPEETGPAKTVIRNGGTADPAIELAPDVSQQQASREIESTNQLLATSDANLKKISGRQLSANQADTVKQIKSYMEQAKTAVNGGDVQRAYNLAVKAKLLSTELVGH